MAGRDGVAAGGEVSIWVVYDHPVDLPNVYVARRWQGQRPTGEVIMDQDLDRLRKQLQGLGLVKLMRTPEDDPVVLETWL